MEKRRYFDAPMSGTSYAILGTGAVGGYYGSLLHRSGAEVHFLLHTEFSHVKEHGLRVDSPKGDFRLPRVSAAGRPEDLPRCDVALVSWKATANAGLAHALGYALKPGGIVVVLQNGLDPEREAAAAAPGAEVLSGLCFLASRREGPGWIKHQDYGSINLAAYSPSGAAGITAAMERVSRDFTAAGIENRLLPDWRNARWRKLVWNIPYNGMCALTGKDTARLMADADSLWRIERLMDEVIAGAKACGVELPGDFRDRMIADTFRMAPYRPSMQLDRAAGRPMELDVIYARPLQAIGAAGGKAPEIESLYRALLDLEAKA